MDELTEYGSLAQLPEDALALFGGDIFSTPGWFASTIAAGLPPGGLAVFQAVTCGGEVCAVLPMLRTGRRLSALTTPYSCLWRPLLREGADAVAVGRVLARVWRGYGVVRLDCMADGAAEMSRGLRQAGLRPLVFDHFGNWRIDLLGAGWTAYLAGRPGQLRSGIVRQTRRLMGTQGGVFTLVQDEAGLDRAIADYEAVYAASWKEPEPSPRFNAALMRACAKDGSLRLGLLHLDDRPIAAQLWLFYKGTAMVLKLAYDEAFRKLAPGNVLTARMIEHLIDVDGAGALDFGRGDDDYKQMWTNERRQRVGILVANPWSPRGTLELGKRWIRRSL